MNLTRYNSLYVLLLAGLLVLAGCEGIADLDVENPNAPNAERAIASPSDLKSVLGGGYSSWWDGTYESNIAFGIAGAHLGGFGDEMTTTNAFNGFWSVAVDEPRVAFQNTLSFADLSIVEVPWQNLNAAVSSANDVIRQIEVNDFEVVIDGTDETQETLAAAYFLRGLAYGHLANYFNQAYVTTEEFDAENDLADLEFSPYGDVLGQARSDFQTARDIANSNSFTVDDYLPFTVPVTSDRLIALANSFEARFIISNPRTATEADAIDWTNIQSLAENGIQEDVVLDLDGNVWFNLYQNYAGLYWYWRVDNRIIQKMDNDYPIKYPASEAGAALPPAESNDARLCPADGDEFQASGLSTAEELGCYFVFDSDQSFFTVNRGPTLQSNYWFARDFVIEQYFEDPFAAGPGPIMLAEENDLMLAEAQVKNGNPSGARTIINNGSRVNIGELDPLPSNASAEEIEEAIYYERDIELYRTGLGLAYYDLRRLGELQAGTPLHLPVPATELQTIGVELYTFGGVGNAGQPGTASGDNAWCDQDGLSCDGPFEVPSGNATVDQKLESIPQTGRENVRRPTPGID